MIDFPASPTLGQQFTAAGVTWVWDGTKWAASGLSVAYLPLTGGTLTGNVDIQPPSGNAALRLRAAAGSQNNITGNAGSSARWIMSLGDGLAEIGNNFGSNLVISRCSDAGAFIDNPLVIARPTGQVIIPNLSAPQAIGDNRIINGDMRIDQRNNGASGTAFGYTCDRWYFNPSVAGKGTWQRQLGVGVVPTGFEYCLSFTSSSAYTPLATDLFEFYQPVEADMVTDFGWGTTPTQAGAQPVTLSFWAQSSLTGTFSGSIRATGGVARSYPFTYSLPTPSTWTKIVVTIPGDTAGAWVLYGNAAALLVGFSLGAGANFSAPANAWAATGNGVAATGSVNVVATNGAIFRVTGVKLEVGIVATPFNRQSLAKSLADCQRYYEVCDAVLAIDGTVGNTYSIAVSFAVEKRASPTITSILQTGTSNGNFNARAVQATVAGPGTRAVTWGGTMVSTGPARGFNDTFSASAEL